METLFYLDPREVALFLKRGEIAAFPTETVYGLGASIFDERAIQKIYNAKGRPQDNPLIAHVATLAQVNEIAFDLPPDFQKLTSLFWPGPLTLIVNRREEVPPLVSGGLPTLGVRMPSHPLARALITEAGAPLVAPSANLSGRPSSTTAQHVFADFRGKIPAILDGGPCSLGIESTVLDLVSFSRPTLLRPGSISRNALEGALGAPIDLYSSGPKASPGMRYRHYAPEAPIHLFSEERLFDSYSPLGKRPLFLSTNPTKPAHQLLTEQSLYFLLRYADTEGYDEIIVYCDERGREALWNRLEKGSNESDRYGNAGVSPAVGGARTTRS